MKKIKLAALLLTSVSVLAHVVIGLRVNSRSNPDANATESLTSDRTDKRILRARQVIEKMPDKSEGYNQLASAYMQKARETANFDFNADAGEAITRSLRVEPDNYDALKLRAKLELTYHRFPEALQTARRAQTVRADDHDVWGQVTDALVELGDYPGAVQSAQRMVDLRPDSSSYARVSYLRSLHGDTQGAIQAMTAAVKAANPNDPEGVAWCRVQLGNELMNDGRLETAEREFDEALRIFPDHALALRGKAHARLAAGDIQGAVELCKREPSSADAAQMLGELYTMLGDEGAARKENEKFETLERENVVVEGSWRHLLNHWLDHDRNLGESLTLARREYEARKDIFTCDSLSWALFKNGLLPEAKKLMNEALRTGTKDARINYHAGVIYKTLNMRDRAAQHLRVAAELNSAFDPVQADSARKMLAELDRR